MSIGAIKADGETLKRVGELIRQGEMDKALQLMEQSFGPAGAEALKKAIAYGITPERIGERLTKAPLAIERFEQRVQAQGKIEKQAQAQEAQVAAQRAETAAKEKAAREAEEAERRFERRMKELEKRGKGLDKDQKKLDKEENKLEKDEKKLRDKMRKEKNAAKRRRHEEKLKEIERRKERIKARRLELDKEREVLNNLRSNEIAQRQQSQTPTTRPAPSTALPTQYMRQNNGR